MQITFQLTELHCISNWNRCSHIHWPVYLLHWNMEQKTEIRSCIKCRIRLNIDSKQIFNELCGIYEPQTISVCTVFRWVKTFKAGKFSLTEEQKTQLLKCARELLKTYKGCNSRVISNLLTVMKPGCTCLNHKEGLIISNGSKKIKNAHVLPREP